MGRPFLLTALLSLRPALFLSPGSAEGNGSAASPTGARVRGLGFAGPLPRYRGADGKQTRTRARSLWTRMVGGHVFPVPRPKRLREHEHGQERERALWASLSVHGL